MYDKGTAMLETIRNQQTLFDIRIWMNTKEAADYLRVTVNSLRLKVWKRQLPAYKFDRHLRFKKTDLDHYMKPLK